MSTLDEELDLLQHARSAKRRSGARRLRKRGDPAAGPALLAALEREVRDLRTWETQYQLVMALGECGYRPALPFLEQLAATPLDATMIYIGLGDALVRLRTESANDVRPVFDIMASGNEMLIDGALRAMAMLRMVPADDEIQRVLEFARRYPPEHAMRIWPLAATPGWSGPQVEAFVKECLESPSREVRDVAASAATRKYRRWVPL